MERMMTIRQVWAVVRFDAPPADATPEAVGDRFYVKEVVFDEQTAKAEVERLNSINGRNGAHYFYQVTRLRERPSRVIPPAGELD